jgi:hypothetical protein
VSIEGISRVFDHVKHKCVLGFKELILAYFDGRTTIPVDFSLHREKGKEKNCGLSDEEREGQFSKQRDENNPDHVRYKELDMKKTDCGSGDDAACLESRTPCRICSLRQLVHH